MVTIVIRFEVLRETVVYKSIDFSPTGVILIIFHAYGNLRWKDHLLEQELKKLHPHLTEEDVATLAAAKIQEDMSHDHLWYRINATRSFGGSHKLTPGLNDKLHEVSYM